MSTLTIAPSKTRGLRIIQEEYTFTGARIRPLQKGLPKTTESLCPECTQVISARLFEENGKVSMEKTCPRHGLFRDTVFSDARLYLKMEEWTFGEYGGVSNPSVQGPARCPDDCGLCSLHTSHTGLANVDLTNRCNLTCPVCFANANAAGYLYEPSFEQVRGMLQALRDERPVATRIVQFSGGEPTIYPRFLDVLRLAKEMGFSHVQAATNGLKFTEFEFAHQAKEAGLHTLYLQLDGVCDDIYRRTRGESLWEKKLEAIENVRRAGMKIVFVPTIVKGLNDHQVGDIVRLAIDNIECVSGISFQPVAFTGRISRHELESKRFTLADLARTVSEQTGLTDMYEDWFPLSCITPFSKLLSALRGEDTTHLTCHPHCSLGTYVFVDRHKHAVPVTRFVDMGPMLKEIDLLAAKAGSQRVKFFTKASAWNALRKFFHEDRAPTGLSFPVFLQTLQGMTDKRFGREAAEKAGFTYKTLMVAGMHFMDHYNYDVERVKRCVIHYSAPNGLIYPFCTYNSGPTFRERIERQFSIPFEMQPELLAFTGQPVAGNGNGHGARRDGRGACGWDVTALNGNGHNHPRQ